jgi:sporulation protein YunB
MNNSVSEALQDAGDTTNLIRVEKDKDGKITMISADSAMMNKIAIRSALNAQRKINELQNTQISIPLGNILGSKLFSGLGPSININVTPLGTVNTNFHTEFESAGINQSRYKVYIILDSNMKMVVGATSQSVEISTEILISDVILVGAVPDTYANLTDSSDFLNLIP